MTRQSVPFEKNEIRSWILINLLLGFVIPLFFQPQDYINPKAWDRLGLSMLYSFLIAMSISGTVAFMETKLQSIPWIQNPLKRLTLEFLGVSVLGFCAVFVVNFIFFWAWSNFVLGNIPWEEVAERTIVPILVGYAVTTFFLSRAFLFGWREAAVDAEKLRAEGYKGQVRFLRDQLNPHFLFNSLNVLTNIVYEDADKAAEYIRQLSRFYRYVLEVQNEEVVPLSREVDFTQRFFNLQQSRFGSALQLEVSINTQNDLVVPPLVLQLLVENAIKHNSISEEHPLKVKIVQEKDMLIVRNNCTTKAQVEESTGIGLNNIKERYRILSDQEVEVMHDNKTFEVYLPLLKLSQNRAV